MQNPIEFFNDTQFFERFRFPKCIVLDILLPIVLKNIKPVIDLRGLPISPIMKLLTALRFYASGCYQRVNGDMYGISQPTISRIVKEISTALCHSLQTWVKFPSIESITEIKNQFYQIAQFPGVTMVMDCTHIQISSPGGEKSEFYRNRKGWMSLNVQLIAGPKLQIFDVVARWPGSAHDSRIFENSLLMVNVWLMVVMLKQGLSILHIRILKQQHKKNIKNLILKPGM
ncbi:putative nuclease HARBI1 [Acyrthosiphon pisum]|uniref:DDE Tnp4 domain-containing protein n=1 Tax=Acyrthosiphon pisum TaxID=7029 RepID=A0A8R2HAN3_ACYPI|nr:putative nuclease HARBI1 [Acyrthosiphon pisum]|eukprot:XP_016661993.1 PREDICTED: putative nuclease HARBI1 [Acyrthosiphon pisum]